MMTILMKKIEENEQLNNENYWYWRKWKRKIISIIDNENEVNIK